MHRGSPGHGQRFWADRRLVAYHAVRPNERPSLHCHTSLPAPVGCTGPLEQVPTTNLPLFFGGRLGRAVQLSVSRDLVILRWRSVCWPAGNFVHFPQNLAGFFTTLSRVLDNLAQEISLVYDLGLDKKGNLHDLIQIMKV